MVRKLIILLLLVSSTVTAQTYSKEDFKKLLKFSTFYAAVNGGTSLSDVDVFSVNNGLSTQTISTPYDYNFAIGLRKIARFGYENKAQTFYDGTETNYSDAAVVGKSRGVEYLFEVDYKRQEGKNYMDQHHFIRYSSDDGCPDDLCINFFALKVEYLEDGFADVKYFEASERYRVRKSRHLSWNIGAAHRLAEPYGYNPLDEWLLDNGDIHYTYLAIQEGYEVRYDGHGGFEYKDPTGETVANSPEVWEAVVIPEVLANYTEKKRNELKKTIMHSMVMGFDYYKYNKSTWMHAWGSVMPYHYDDGSQFSYHNYVDGQWADYALGFIYGIKHNKQLGYFVEGKYNRYWNRTWYDFKLGMNYVIFSMAKELNEDTGFQVSIKTLVGIGAAMATVISMWFMLQADIAEARTLPEPPPQDVSRMEFDMKDKMIRQTIMTTQEDVEEMKKTLERIEDKLYKR